jgi:hypothetical protein
VLRVREALMVIWVLAIGNSRRRRMKRRFEEGIFVIITISISRVQSKVEKIFHHETSSWVQRRSLHFQTERRRRRRGRREDDER